MGEHWFYRTLVGPGFVFTEPRTDRVFFSRTPDGPGLFYLEQNSGGRANFSCIFILHAHSGKYSQLLAHNKIHI